MGKPNFEAEPVTIQAGSDIPWNRWPGRVTAAQTLGVSPRQLKAMVQEGTLKEYKAPDESRRYNPEELEEISGSIAEARASDAAENQTKVGGVAIEGMRTAQDLLKQQQAHNERLVNLVIVGFEKSMDAMSRMLDRMATHNERLEQTHYVALEAADAHKALTMQVETEGALKLAAEQRRTTVVQTLLPQVAPVLSAVAGKWMHRFEQPEPPGSEPPEPPEPPEPTEPTAPTEPPVAPVAPVAPGTGEKAVELLRRVGPEKLNLLLSSGLLDETVESLAREVIEEIGQ